MLMGIPAQVGLQHCIGLFSGIFGSLKGDKFTVIKTRYLLFLYTCSFSTYKRSIGQQPVMHWGRILVISCLMFQILLASKGVCVPEGLLLQVQQTAHRQGHEKFTWSEIYLSLPSLLLFWSVGFMCNHHCTHYLSSLLQLGLRYWSWFQYTVQIRLYKFGLKGIVTGTCNPCRTSLSYLLLKVSKHKTWIRFPVPDWANILWCLLGLAEPDHRKISCNLDIFGEIGGLSGKEH